MVVRWPLADVVAVTFGASAPGTGPRTRVAEFESGAGPAYDNLFWTAAVGPGFFEASDRPIVAGRAFHGGDRSPAARTVIVNEAFARGFLRDAGSGSPIGARLRYSASSAASGAAATEPWFEIVGVVRDLGVTPDDEGDERPYVFHAAAAGTVAPLVMSARVRGNPATLVARLPVIAADVDAGLHVDEARPLGEWIRRRDTSLMRQAGALAGVTSLVLLLSAMGIFSLMSVSVSGGRAKSGCARRLAPTRAIVLAGILSRAMVLMGSGSPRNLEGCAPEATPSELQARTSGEPNVRHLEPDCVLVMAATFPPVNARRCRRSYPGCLDLDRTAVARVPPAECRKRKTTGRRSRSERGHRSEPHLKAP